ncbi:MAG TPA: hypothetical protein VE914_15005 [Candidatus Angelobacter sp.]|nr:hypothetical protein [Candidatus Angelobacter sp.]
MTPRRFLPMAALLSAATVSAASQADGPSGPFVATIPATAKDALRLVFHNADLPLPRGGSCEGVDTTGIENPTIGDYLGGFLAELRPAKGMSGVAAACTGGLSDLSCEITVRREAGDEVWAWGLRFRANGITGTIRPEGLECTGAG